jgi:hypothetical protein
MRTLVRGERSAALPAPPQTRVPGKGKGRGNFRTPAITTYTNFFFSMHVGLDGARRGVLLYGEAQETATVLQEDASSHTLRPLALLQRQFSIALVSKKNRPARDTL